MKDKLSCSSWSSFCSSICHRFAQLTGLPLSYTCANEPVTAQILKKCHLYFMAQIGVVGWITPDTSFLSKPGPLITFSPVIPAVTACIQEMKRNNDDLDIIIGLSHTGTMVVVMKYCRPKQMCKESAGRILHHTWPNSWGVCTCMYCCIAIL